MILKKNGHKKVDSKYFELEIWNYRSLHLIHGNLDAK